MKATDWFTFDAVPDGEPDVACLQLVKVRAGAIVGLSHGKSLVGFQDGARVYTIRLTTVNGDVWLIPKSASRTIETLQQELTIE